MKKEDLRETKIYLSNVEDRVKFQKKMFSLGIKWLAVDGVRYTDSPFYYISRGFYLTLETNSKYFRCSDHKQIFLDEVLSIEEPKEEFKPFDKVLVVNNSNVWVPRFFSRYDGEDTHPFETTDGSCYKACIPYEGNEGLANTTKNPWQ